MRNLMTVLMALGGGLAFHFALLPGNVWERGFEMGSAWLTAYWLLEEAVEVGARRA